MVSFQMIWMRCQKYLMRIVYFLRKLYSKYVTFSANKHSSRTISSYLPIPIKSNSSFRRPTFLWERSIPKMRSTSNWPKSFLLWTFCQNSLNKECYQNSSKNIGTKVSRVILSASTENYSHSKHPNTYGYDPRPFCLESWVSYSPNQV